jgi:hypothetical protein
MIFANQQIDCPACGPDAAVGIHISAVSVVQGGPQTIITRTDVRHDYAEPDNRRGSTISIALWCETGHLFGIIISFHKGTVYIEHTDAAQLPTNDADEPIWPQELWRD